jgi:hypothetical protein
LPKPPNPLRRSILPPVATTLLLGIGLTALAIGCRSEEVSHYRVPKEAMASHPDHPGHAEEGMGSQGMPSSANTDPGMPPPPTPKGAIKWSLPKGWTDSPGGGTMRFATFKSPYAGKLEATVVVLPGPAGGELANVNRWRGQIGLPALDEASLTKSRAVLKTKAGALNVYDFTSEGQAKSRLVAGYISTPDGNTWFLKMTGDADPVGKAKPDFMTILGSVRLD